MDRGRKFVIKNGNLFFLGGKPVSEGGISNGEGIAGLATLVAGTAGGVMNANRPSIGGSALTGAASGAAAGAALGPWGAAIGGAIGGIGGAVKGVTEKKKFEEEERIQGYANYKSGTAAMSPYSHIYAVGGPLTEFNEGGRHEENPNGGIPQGFSRENGKQNLVEEGETKHKDFIFSDRLKLKNSEAYNLGGKMNGKSFASISKTLAKIAKERPNDAISKRGSEVMLNRLKMANEDMSSMSSNSNVFEYGGYKFNDY